MALEGFVETAVEEVTVVSRKTKLLLSLGLIASIAIFTFLSRQFHVPHQTGYGGNLLGDPAWLVSLIVVAAGLFASVALATLIVGHVRFDAGLFCATAGMTALSMRSGRMGDVLRYTPPNVGTSVFVTFAVELVCLYALVALAWSALWALHKGGRLNADEFRDGVEDTDEPTLFKTLAMLMQVGVMTLLVLLIVQSDSKAQVIAGVALAAFVGSWSAYSMYPISPSPWLWVGPLIVGAAGYVLAYVNVPRDDVWRTGTLDFMFAPLARPLPVDYATAGPAGALLGYWVGRRGHRQRVAEEAANREVARRGGAAAPAEESPLL